MNTTKILSWVSLMLGEALIVAAFLLFRKETSDNILILNIVVSSLIYGLLFIDILVPWIDFGDKSQKTVGSLGIRWFFTGLYSISAIAVMIIGNVVFKWTFLLQIFIHGGLIFLLLLGFSAAFLSSDEVEKVYGQETANRSGIIGMKTALQKLKDRMTGLPDLPEYFINHINSFEENLRFISPANSQEAYDLERSFENTVNDIAIAVSNFSMNEEAISMNIKKLERILQSRKQVYSN